MPSVFGLEHLLYTIVSFGFLITLLVLFKKYATTDEKIELFIKIGGGILLLAIIWNRLSIAIIDDNFPRIIPGTFCGASSLALAIGILVFKKDSPYFHCVAFIGFLGGLLTIIYPDFIGQDASFFYAKTISGLVHHSIITFLVIAMIMSGYVKPRLNKWHFMPIGLSFYMIYGLFLITMLGYNNAMLIHEPILSGTPLNWFVMGILVLMIHTVFLVSYERFVVSKQS